jgi:predicted glycosyltransferase
LISLLPGANEPTEPRRFLFYSHDGLGLGEVRRSLAIARELAELNHDISVLLVTGAEDVESLGVPARVGILKLPGLQKSERSAAGLPEVSDAEVHVLRERLLAATAETFQPEVVLVDGYPFGVDGELGPALEIARAFGGQAVLGLCDVIDDPGSVDIEWHARGLFERISALYARVLVYGQPDVLDPVRDSGFPQDVARLTSFCGYVVSAAGELPEPPGADGPPRILATAGGGADGFPLLETFIEVASRARWNATVVAGPECPPDRVQELDGLARGAGVTFRHFVPSLMAEFSSLDALVCMGGYNTLAEAVASGVPTVCVPRVGPSRDQLVRAEAFARRRLIRMVTADRLTPEGLRTEIDAALLEHAVPARLDVGGARRAAQHLMELALQRASRPRSRQRTRVA